MTTKLAIASHFSPKESAVVYKGDCRKLLSEIPDKTVQLVVTSPPYNIGKQYEKRLKLDQYLEQQAEVSRECIQVLQDAGRVCQSTCC